MRMIVLISHDQLQAGRRSYTSPAHRNPSRPGMADDETTYRASPRKALARLLSRFPRTR